MKIAVATGCLLFASSFAWGLSGGAPPMRTNAPGEGVCTACHTTNALNSGSGRITVTFANATYTPGETQKVTVAISDPNARRWGFEASPRLASSASTGAGEVSPRGDGFTRIAGTNGSLQWITHTSEGTRMGTTGSITFEFDWKAPATNVGDVDFYVAANAANGNGNPTGDFIYATKVTISAGGGPVQRPSISENGVASAATSRAGVVAGSWITIFGQNLSTTTRAWRGDEIVNGVLPKSLDGVSVTVNGKPAAISYISGTQINAQAPDDSATGNVAVVVKNAAGESTPTTVSLQQFSPAFFLFSPQNAKYIAAVATDGTLLGPAGLFGAGTTTRPARPGETISLFGTGFGPTNPAVPAGQNFSGAANLANPATVTIGGMNATVTFAGLSGPGLYQLNVTVPQLPSGDQAVVATVGGVQSPAGASIAVAP